MHPLPRSSSSVQTDSTQDDSTPKNRKRSKTEPLKWWKCRHCYSLIKTAHGGRTGVKSDMKTRIGWAAQSALDNIGWGTPCLEPRGFLAHEQPWGEEAKRKRTSGPWTRRSNQKPLLRFSSQILTQKPHKRLLTGSVPSKGLTCAPRDSLAFGFAHSHASSPHGRLQIYLGCQSEECISKISFRTLTAIVWTKIKISVIYSK